MRAALVTPAIVLRRVPYSESDLVVTLFGERTGRVAALARGARKSTRRFAGGLGLGASGEAVLRDRAGAELMWLERFEADEPRVGLAGDLARTAHAAYAVELCEKLCAPRHPEPETFRWLLDFLRWLELRGAGAPALRVFELGLLRRLGLGPSLEACVACGRRDLQDEQVRWRPDGGGVACRTCAGGVGSTGRGVMLSADTRRALARFAVISFEEAARQRLDPAQNALCRRSVLELLRVHIPGALKSLEFIEKARGGPS